MDISIVIASFNEEKNIRACLETLVNQNYRDGQYEIVVSDGGSKDHTQSIVKEFGMKYPNVRLVIETKNGTAAGRNAGITAAVYDYIAFIDADCEAPEDWLTMLAGSYRTLREKDPNVVAVGGANIPPEDSKSFLRAIGVALDSFAGSFNSAQGRIFMETVYVPSLPNLNVLYNKRAIVQAGYYDESLVSEAEDADMNFRLSSAGWKFVFVPGSYVWHKMRPTPMTWLRNMFRYGKGRARLLKRYPEMWSVSFLLPLFFAAGISSILLAPLNSLFFLPALYFPLLFLFSVFQSFKKRFPGLVLHVMSVYMIQHFGYAAGEVFGLLHPRVR
jgi:GT2 family glycosyltransferase